MNNLIMYLAPPVLGAIIGYITNAIAIKMLFRPLYPIKIGPFQLPFTPGILPRERHKLADNIGRMVEKELLTEEIIRQRLTKPDVVIAIQQGVSSATVQILDTPLKGNSELAKEVIQFLVKMIHNPRILDSIESLVDRLLEQLQQRNLAELTGKEVEEIQNFLQEFILQKLEQTMPGATQGLITFLDAHYIELKDRIIAFLRQPDIHRQLEIQGRVFLQKTLQKLNTFQRFFISAAQYDKTLEERMGDIIDDLISQIDILLSTQENRRSLVLYIQQSLLDLGQKQETLYRFSGMVYGFIAPLLYQNMGDLIHKIAGWDTVTQRKVMIQKLSSWIVHLDEITIQHTIGQFFADHDQYRIGDLIQLDAVEKSHIDERIARALINLANTKIADALRAINIRSIVSERIDSLDMEDVERIVLDVMASQFKWINVFGAILGALIGAGQIILSIYIKGIY
ncbi:DUF445 family protein [Gracilinema caldarium]|uniref:DUF445 family protein n=1 Tax=Gracilinema caldarium (strain ATCC 51460 / DSM 7334 / H1) TaxID=744872 RepID=F8EXK0_GRAC1|nr:DUF445 family protein [Gracilinema caldarium]AEJ19581.1 protein of unknown function DUF445 [Gracilinema caldarium DSM 7334]